MNAIQRQPQQNGKMRLAAAPESGRASLLAIAGEPSESRGEYFHRSTTYDERSDIAIFDEITLDKQDQEIELAIAGIDKLLAHNLFANAYYDFALGPALVSYAGVGAGVASTVALLFYQIGSAMTTPAGLRRLFDPDLNARDSRFNHDRSSATDRPPHRLSTARRRSLSDRRSRRSGPQVAGWMASGDVRKRKNTNGISYAATSSTVGRGEPILYTITTDDTQFCGRKASACQLYQF